LYASPNTPNKNDEVKKNGIGRACGTNGKEEECIQGSVGTPEGNIPVGRAVGGGRIILKWISEKQYGVVRTGLIYVISIGISGGLL
jgi:hypothetical protein